MYRRIRRDEITDGIVKQAFYLCQIFHSNTGTGHNADKTQLSMSSIVSLRRRINILC